MTDTDCAYYTPSSTSRKYCVNISGTNKCIACSSDNDCNSGKVCNAPGTVSASCDCAVNECSTSNDCPFYSKNNNPNDREYCTTNTQGCRICSACLNDSQCDTNYCRNPGTGFAVCD